MHHDPLRALITLGPTHESIDAVRFIGNRSSGRMGVEIARALQAAGCDVRVLAGPCSPDGLDSLPSVQRFRTAEELRDLLARSWPACDLLVMAAAVADWRPTNRFEGKHRRGDTAPTIALEAVPEILGTLSSRADQFRVGFALEPAEELLASAKAKLTRKRADCIVANPLETMDSESVQGCLVWPDGHADQPDGGALVSKRAFANWLANAVLPAATARCRQR